MRKIIVFLLTFFICLPVFSQSLLFSLIESGVESSQQKKKEKNLQLFENNYNKAVNGNFQKNKIYYNDKFFEFDTFEEFKKQLSKLNKKNVVIYIPENSNMKFKLREIVKSFPRRGGYVYREEFENYFGRNDHDEKYIERLQLAKKIVVGLEFHKGSIPDETGFYISSVYGLMSQSEYEYNKQKVAEQIAEQIRQEKEYNNSLGYGYVTNQELTQILEQERTENENAGKGRFTNKELLSQIERNKEAGLGEFNDSELEGQRKRNEEAGKGYKTDLEIKKEENFAKISEMVKQASEYESKKQICYSLGILYDAMMLEKRNGISDLGTEKYNELSSIIRSGRPGRGSYNDFQYHDEWKNLLIDAEKYGTEYGRFKFTIGKLQQGNLDYSTKTATFFSSIKIKDSDRYKNTISVISSGYSEAYKNDWEDMPLSRNWPEEDSVSGQMSEKNLVNGVAIYRSHLGRNMTATEKYTLMSLAAYGADVSVLQKTGVYNAFAYGQASGKRQKISNYKEGWFENILYDLKFNIVDENGKEIVKAKRYLPILYAGTDSGRIDWDNKVEFEKIPQSVIEKIENGKARINLVAAYLEYGEYSEADDTGSDASDSNQNRAFIKNFPEIQLSLEKLDYEILDAPIQTDKED